MKKSNGFTVKAALILMAAGLILSITAFCCGAVMGQVKTGLYKESETDMYDEFSGEVKKLDIDIKAGKVVIQPGEILSVKSSRVIEKYIGVDFEDGCLKVEEDQWNFRKVLSWLPGNDYSPEIIITIPEGTVLEEAEIDVGAGQGVIRDITARKLSGDVSAGELKGINLTVQEEGSLEVKTGSIDMSRFRGNGMELECRVGSIKLEGSLTGKTAADCNVGEIRLILEGKESDYHYDVDCNLGDVIINDSHYSGVNNTVKRENTDGYEMRLTCDVGSIKVTTEQ